MDGYPGKIVMGEVTDPAAIARALAQRSRFDRNWAWLQSHAPEVYDAHRGRCICVAGEELFVADTPKAVIELAKAAHPEDDGRFVLYLPCKQMERIYAPLRTVVPRH